MRALVGVAVALVLAFAALHAGGLRVHTAVLSGTILDANSVTLGLGYTLAYFACVVVAPILVIAGLILKLLERSPTRSSS